MFVYLIADEMQCYNHSSAVEEKQVVLYLAAAAVGKEEQGPGRGRRLGLAERKALWVVNVLEA